MRNFFAGVLSLCLLGVFLVITFSCSAEHKASVVGKRFVNCYYADFNFEQAKQLTTPGSHDIIEEHATMVEMNPYAKDEVPMIEWDGKVVESDDNRMVFSYRMNRVEKDLVLVKTENGWKVDLALPQSSSMQRLSSGEQGGFASAVSGPIKYKKRNTKH